MIKLTPGISMSTTFTEIIDYISLLESRIQKLEVTQNNPTLKDAYDTYKTLEAFTQEFPANSKS